MANHVITIDVEARFKDSVTSQSKAASKSIEGIEKSAEEAQKELNNLGKKKAKPKIDVDDNLATKKLNKAEKLLSKLGRLKPSVLLKAEDKATAVINKIKNAAKGFAGKSYSALIKIRDSNVLSTLNKMSNGLKGIVGKTWYTAVKIKDYATAPLTKLKETLFSIKSLVLAITAGLAAKQLVINPISLADQYSSAKIGFSTLLGESAGQQMMNDLDAFAKATPFKSSEVIGQTQRMLAMGWDAENIIDDMTTIGDAAAATGKGEQGLQQIVTALAQIKTKGRLSTEELNQLAEAGVSAKKYIAEGLGYGSGDEGIAAMTKDLEKGAIASNKALTALLEGMKEYQGMMDKTANETVEGLKSQLEDTFEINILRRWGQGLQDGAKRGFGEIVTLLDKADGALEQFGDTVYEVGKTISNWAADKLENTIKRITEITDSYEFRNASLGEKLSMLWNGVIVDPLKEWWEGGGRQKTAETAGKIGSWMGEMLTKGLLALFGATDILDEGIGTNAGSSIAGSFLQGFLDNFDGQAITDAFVDAIKNIWGALPTWAKVLIGGYGIGKAAGGIANFAGGVANFAGGVAKIIGSSGTASGVGGSIVGASGLLGLLGNTGVAGVGASGILGALSKAGYTLVGGTSALSMGGGTAALIGGGAIAGGLAGGAAAVKGGIDLYGSYKAYKSGDTTEAKAKGASGGTALGGVAVGAGIGALIGGPVGALIGAGVGGIAGWIGGNKWADSIRKTSAEAKYEVEGVAEDIENAATEEEKLAELSKAAWENMKRHMGDIKLSAAEIESLTTQLVWGDDIKTYETFSSAVKTAAASLETMKSAADTTNRWMFKAALGVKFNEDEIESIKASFDEYINSAKSYVENKHYEFSAAVSLLVDVESEKGKSILESGNAFYSKLQKQLDDLGGKLSDKVEIALKDGVITLDEHQEIVNLQKQIAAITEKVSNAETKAELELIKVKFGKGNLDLDSFDSFMAQMETTLNERIAANDEAFKASVATLNLELAEGAITEEEYNKQLQTLVDRYTGKVEKLKAEIMSLELDIIGESYEDVLGKNAGEKLQKALEKSLSEGIHPKDWTPEEARRFLGVDNLKDDAAKAIATMLGGVADQIELIEVDGKLLLDLGIETEGDTGEKVKETVDKSIPESMDTTISLNIVAQKNIANHVDILAEEFGIPEDKAETILWKISGTKGIQNKIEILCEEFGINKTEAETILWKLSGTKSIMSTVSLYASDFGIKNSYTFSPTINVNPKRGNVTSSVAMSLLGGFRGGIFGSANGIQGYSDGGIVRGGSKLIKVAEEGSPEMVIPLSSQRRERGLKLWEKAGEMMNVPGFARGGRTDGGQDEGIRNRRYGTDGATGGTVQIDVGGVNVEIKVDANGATNVAEAIKAQAAEIAETVAGALADALSGQFENTPAKGGVA